MCGINGIFSYSKIQSVDTEKIRNMNKEMIYRGPDEQDVWTNSAVALGHVRLSIIAINDGHQPLFNEDCSIVLICNGEIYNHQELKTRLKQKGHKFKTKSDSEVIIHLFEEYGMKFLLMLNGMFSFALYDIKNHNVYLARDRQGKKPLYYLNSPRGFIFSSEIKAINKQWVENPSINYNIVNQIKTHSYSISNNETYIKEIKKVQPGSYLKVSPKQIEETQFWKRKITNKFKGSYQNAKEGILEHIEQAVKIRLESDVPMAVLLSGGVDSTTVAYFAKKHKPNIKALTISYKGNHDCDESELATKFANDNNIDLIKIELDYKDYEQYFQEFISVLDEPNGDIATFAQWGLYKKAKELGYKVLLSGNGGDELFFGYPYFNHVSDKIEQLTKFQEKYLPVFGYKDFISLLIGVIKNNNLFRNFKPKKDILPFLNFENDNNGNGTQIMKSNYFNSKLSTPDSVYEFVFNIWLTNNCFHLADKLGMGNTVEIRSPFADINLVDFVHSLPITYRYDKKKPKRLLKEAIEEILPTYILKQPKRGFTPPIDFVNNVLPVEYTTKNLRFPYAKYVIDKLLKEIYEKK